MHLKNSPATVSRPIEVCETKWQHSLGFNATSEGLVAILSE